MGPEGRSALVTGGSSGIGLAITRALLQEGWRVAICGRDPARLAEAAKGADASDRLLAAACDVSRADEVRNWVAAARDHFGPPALLVNNAGVGARAEIASLSEEQWDRALDINLKGAFLCTREVLPAMRSRGGGWIINISSVSGKKGFAGSSAYSASKFGLIGFTESLAREEAPHGIRATSICPGFVATPMVADAEVPAVEMIHPDEIARTVLYLLSLGPNVAIREIVLERPHSL